MTNNSPRRIDVFFYGLFMDEALLRTKNLDPQDRRLASVENFKLTIGERATLVPSPGDTVHGVLFSLTHSEIDSLYADASLGAYRPEAVAAKAEDGSAVPALCFNLPASNSTAPNPEYAAKLKELGERIGLPAAYIATIA